MSIENKLARINEMRLKLRADLLEKMRTNPTMKDSETLRLLENDISFWDAQTDRSTAGLIATLQQSLNREDD